MAIRRKVLTFIGVFLRSSHPRLPGEDVIAHCGINLPAIAANSNRACRTVLEQHGVPGGAGSEFPEAQRLIFTTGDCPAPVRRLGHGRDQTLMPVEALHFAQGTRHVPPRLGWWWRRRLSDFGCFVRVRSLLDIRLRLDWRRAASGCTSVLLRSLKRFI